MASDTARTEPISTVVGGAIETPAPSQGEEKGNADVSSRPVTNSEAPKAFPQSWKITALVCGLALSWGSSFSENTLGPLKGTLKKELNITNAQVSTHDYVVYMGTLKAEVVSAQYGAISSATSLVNTVLPILGGCALDHYGVEW